MAVLLQVDWTRTDREIFAMEALNNGFQDMWVDVRGQVPQLLVRSCWRDSFAHTHMMLDL